MRDVIREYTPHKLETYSSSKNSKFVGAGIILSHEGISTGICAHNWRKLDVFCMLLKMQTTPSDDCGDTFIDFAKQAVSAAREVIPGAEGAIQTVEGVGEYKNTVHKPSWNIGVKYIPEADAEVFRITKPNHNILQGVARPEVRFDSWNQTLLNKGADVVVIGDPQMPALIPLIKKARPEHKIIYPSHIEVRKDLVEPVDLIKGITDVTESYRKLYDRVITDAPERLPPQLLICVHGAIDGPDPEIVFAETTQLLKQSRYAAIAKDVVVVRIGPSDQMLNAMITTAKDVLQLSLRQGFEVKVSEALRHGNHVVATRAGDIPLQIENGKSGFLVVVGDTDSIANHLFDFYTDNHL
ncbi:hypothetical protein HOY82DRAFT_609549 [Tuber indicum]|nr:hypothetical protein HOY82DRAFT_609549 [Tuber indicum]